ncbi:MAG: histone deacetylase [Deltaproteobacteria bacterium RIFOXYD12_FULL_56_24]|nr:MAG: histone deacetylase [Deltaproteobacteria bacterium RIFOXYD12_FULL_56_24]
MPLSRPLAIVTHPLYLAHDTGGNEHPETPARLTSLLTRLQDSPLKNRLSFIEPRKAQQRWLTTFHDEHYLFRLEECALSGKTHLDHRDNQLCFASYEAALLSAGAGLTGIDLLEGGDNLVFCAVRPPGHHAERNLALGFCFLNNCVLAARYWQQQYGRRKILILDFDAHHGNGIQSAFEEDPEVFYLSLHEHPTFSFPGSGYAEEAGTGPGRGTTLNIPLPPGADERLVLEVLHNRVAPVLAAFAPERIIVAAGFDGHRADDMSGLAYSTELYGRFGEYLAGWANRFCQGKLLSILEGGYHLESLADSATAYLTALSNHK